MKNLYCVIAVLFLCWNASAQTRVTANRDTSKRAVILNGSQESKPLILVDGLAYKGNVNELSPDNISEVHVVRDGNYAKIYGKAAANGVIIITTKGHTSIYKPSALASDMVNNSGLPDNALYVIDGAMSDNKLEGIDPKDILSIEVIKENKAVEPMEGSTGRATIIVVTNAGAIKSYQNKFSAFSSAYKNYVNSHNGDDTGLIYRIDGYECDRGADGITRLYKLPKEKLSKIKISTASGETKVDITTKK